MVDESWCDNLEDKWIRQGYTSTDDLVIKVKETRKNFLNKLKRKHFSNPQYILNTHDTSNNFIGSASTEPILRSPPSKRIKTNENSYVRQRSDKYTQNNRILHHKKICLKQSRTKKITFIDTTLSIVDSNTLHNFCDKNNECQTHKSGEPNNILSENINISNTKAIAEYSILFCSFFCFFFTIQRITCTHRNKKLYEIQQTHSQMVYTCIYPFPSTIDHVTCAETLKCLYL